MTPTASASLVAHLFAAAGRQYGQTELVVYAKALYLVPDDVGEVVVEELVRQVSWDNPPSTGMVVKHAQAVMRRRQDEAKGIPEATGEPVSQEESLAWVRRIRDEHGGSMTDALEDLAMRQPKADA